ncbi:MAG: bifunctional precorrin-2 dehydrogenase/sirohydrochlorin ferrochelatase [Myxococcales bacterium]
MQPRGRRVVVVGAGEVAERRVRALLDAGARVTLVAPEASAGLARLARQGRLGWERRRYREGDLRGAFVAFAASDDRDANRAVAAEARRRGILVNAADDPGACDFTMPAVARSGPVCVAVSTGGTSPTLAQHLRDALARRLLWGRRSLRRAPRAQERL